MADRRTTQVTVQVEYKTPTNERRTSQALLMVEYDPVTNERRTSQLLLMVEYSKPWGAVARPGILRAQVC